MQGASVKQTRSVCSERARTPAGGRSRCVFAKQIRGFSAQRPGPISMRCRLSSGCPCPAPTQAPNRGESNSMQGASVKQTRSVCSERARTPAGGRSRCVFAKQIRGFSAKTSTQNGCDVYRISAGHAPHQRIPPYRGESNSMQGAGVKKTPWQRRSGRAFPMAAQAESTSQNPRSDWDVVSG